MRNRLTRVVLVIFLAGAVPATGSATSNQENKIQNPQKGQRKPVDKIILDVNLVNLNVTVTDRYGRFVTGLTREHFEVYDDKVKQNIELFSNEDAPVSLGVVYDVSGSMKSRINRSARALNRFFETATFLFLR